MCIRNDLPMLTQIHRPNMKVVFRNGEGALQYLPKLLDIIPEVGNTFLAFNIL